MFLNKIPSSTTKINQSKNFKINNLKQNLNNNEEKFIDDDDDDDSNILIKTTTELDKWIDNQLQKNFKKLNSILHENNDEIFFIQQMHQDNKINDEKINDEIKVTKNINDESNSNSNRKYFQYLENIINNDSIDTIDTLNLNNDLNNDVNPLLLCLILTRPNNKFSKKQDDDDDDGNNIIYKYPSIQIDNNNNNQSLLRNQKINNPSIQINNRLNRLSGMFVTLLDVMVKIEHQQQVKNNNEDEIYSIANVQLLNDQDEAPEYCITFINDNSTIMAIAMPTTDDDVVKFITKLLYDNIRLIFGSLNFFKTINNGDDKLLNKLFKTVNLMLKFNQCDNFLFNSLYYYNLLPIFNTTTMISLNNFNLDINNRINLLKYLNDYDSLDWIDESLKFYKNGNDNLEQALSEHFSRCLYQDEDKLLLNNFDNKMFDLLEIELTFFTIIGSCLFYQQSILLQSNLSKKLLSIINNYLFVRSINLLIDDNNCFVNFIRINDNIMNDNKQPKDLFLLIQGYGHFIHCTIIQVYRFDSSLINDDDDFTQKYCHNKNDDQRKQIPSSFAFYIFIKESFRLFNFYLNQFKLINNLDYLYKLNKLNNKFRMENLYLKKFNNTNHNLNSNWFNRINPFNKLLNDDDEKFNFTNIGDTKISIDYKLNDDYNHVNIDDLSSINDSIYSESTIQSISTIDNDYTIVYHDNLLFTKYLPNNLLFYLIIDCKKFLSTFYGPIFDQSNDLNGNELFVKNLTLQLLIQMDRLRKKFKKFNHHNQNELKLMKKFLLKFNYNGQLISDNENEDLLQLKLLIIGKCQFNDKMKILNEFYGCFYLSNNQIKSFKQQFQLNKLIFRNNQNLDDPDDNDKIYNVKQIDTIWREFDRLIQNVCHQ